MIARWRRPTAALLLALAWLPGSASRAATQEGAAPDSLGDYLRTLSDTTDAFFGAAGAPVDTAGLDSALTHRLAQPWLRPRTHLWRPSFGPWWSFNRVDGPLWGGTIRFGRDDRLGEFRGRLGTVTGPNQSRGGGSWARRWRPAHETGATWRLEAAAGRFTDRLDSDRTGSWMNVARAFLSGSDRHSYLRRDGATFRLGRATPTWRGHVGFRSQLETPLSTTATWNLFDVVPDLIPNAPATRGRVRELGGEVASRIPRLPASLAVAGRWSDGALGSEFDYRRLRATAAAEVALGGVVALVPELEYGRLVGEALPQACFFLGGSSSLRSLETNTYAGTGRTFARLDAIFVPDLLALARLPHPAALPIQGALFTASGAVWGRDPFGAGSSENHWPDAGAWRSEVGVSLLYRPGVPDPSTFMRLDLAQGIGPGDAQRVTFYFHAPLDRLPFASRPGRR